MRGSLAEFEVHRPVLVDEVVRRIVVKPDGYYIDGTAGAGGHLEALAKRFTAVHLLGIDRDAHILEVAKERLHGRGVEFLHGTFDELEKAVEILGVSRVDGILLDLGVSSLQFDQAERGFSFSKEAALDMRMNADDETTAAGIIAESSEEELADLLRNFGEEPFAKRIARRIVEERRRQSITTTTELAEIVARAVPRKAWPRRIHPATRTFQALRIAVNAELGHLDRFLEKVPRFLNAGGRVAVISYHSLEDRRVKHSFLKWQREGVLVRVTKKPLTPSEEEIAQNPRARSAKLRVAEKSGEGVA